MYILDISYNTRLLSVARFLRLIAFWRAPYRQHTQKLKIFRQSSESVESPSIPWRHKLQPSFHSPSPLFLPLPFEIVMISLRALKSANFIQEMITFTSRQQTWIRGSGENSAAPGYKSAISVFRTLTSRSGSTVARQMPSNQHAIVRASRRREPYRNFGHASLV